MWAAMAGAPFEATAECLGACKAGFVSSKDYRQYLRKYPGTFARPANYLWRDYKDACDQISMVGLGSSIVERVAKFLLAWSDRMGTPTNQSPFLMSLHQEQIAEYFGTTRESVSRTLSEFRNRGLIEQQGSTFTIPNRKALARFHLQDQRWQGERSRQPIRDQPPVIRISEWAEGKSRRKRA